MNPLTSRWLVSNQGRKINTWPCLTIESCTSSKSDTRLSICLFLSQGTRNLYVKESAGLSFHYRSTCPPDEPKCLRKKSVVDRSSHRFINKLASRVAEKCVAIFGSACPWLLVASRDDSKKKQKNSENATTHTFINQFLNKIPIALTPQLQKDICLPLQEETIVSIDLEKRSWPEKK